MSSQKRKLLVFASGESKLGETLAEMLAEAGNDVVIATSSPKTDKHGERRTLAFNTHASDAEEEVARLLREVGPIDALVLADAVTGKTRRFEELSSMEWNEVLHQNATLGFLLCKLAIPALSTADSGRIIFLLPEDVRGTPAPDAMPFVVAKATSVGLMRTLALELGANGITANAIACPLVASADLRDGALGAREIFATLAFLLSPTSGFLTGQVVDVNGGRSML